MYTLLDDTPDFLVISKHPGVGFHKGPAAPGLAETLRADLGRAEIFPVHRLDNITSGLLMFAKNKDALRELSRQFRERLIHKLYVAIGDGRPKKKQGTIIGDMIKGRGGIWILSRTTTNPAITQFFSAGLGNGLRMYLLHPLTGKTHQLRVALKSIGAPVVGDDAYAGVRYVRYEPDRAYLHAYALRFCYKDTEYSYCNTPSMGHFFLDQNFTTALARFHDIWQVRWPKLKHGSAEKKNKT